MESIKNLKLTPSIDVSYLEEQLGFFFLEFSVYTQL